MTRKNHISYFVFAIVAGTAMLLAPARSIAQPSGDTAPGVAKATVGQPVLLPPLPVAQPETRALEAPIPSYLEREYIAGRTELVIWSTLGSLYGGIALSDMLDRKDVRLGAATVLTTTGLGFLTSNYATKDAKITRAMADAYGFGMMIGAANGLLTSAAFADYQDRKRVIHAATLAGMSFGGTIGFAVAKKTNPTRGQVAFTALSAKLGLATSGLGLLMAESESRSDSRLLALSAGLNLGALTGAAVAPGVDWSLARVRRVGLGALLGAVGGWATAAMITNGTSMDGVTPDRDKARIWAASTLLGMWGGFGVSTYLTKDMPPAHRFAHKRGTTITPMPVRGGGMGLSLNGSF